ncbi:MAG: flagellar biosynthesis protein FlhA, partial [Planctomycetales bacterium]
MPPTQTSAGSAFGRATEFILPAGVIACLLVMLVPLPAAMIDVLLIGSIALSVVVLLTTIYVRTPLEFNVFPTLLLAATLMRLVLNIATTRLILTQAGTSGLRAAGGVIQSFGDFVAGGNLVVGLIIFSIILLIQFVVITKGASRISEVAARFALDGMPGRQMAIDADLNAGLIDSETAQNQRSEIQQQADFLGAMDGASKFVRGDAIAGLFITMVNIVGGLVIGVMQLGMGPAEAGQIFTKLTIGDGLASQLPALLIALAAGLLVTRGNKSTNLPTEFLNQIFSRPQALAVAAAFLALLMLTSLPRLPLIVLASACVGLSFSLSRSNKKKQTPQAEPTQDTQPKIEDLLAVDPLAIEIGIGLIRIADRSRGGDLLDRIQRVRENVAANIGIVMPKVRVRDNSRLKPNQYRIKIFESVVAEETARSSAVVARHLLDSIEQHACEILTRDATRYLIDQLKQTQPVVVSELFSGNLTLAEVQQVLQNLLREQVPIRQLATILEAIQDNASRTPNPLLLAEYARQRLSRTITTQASDSNGTLHVICLGTDMEIQIREAAEYSDYGISVRVPPLLTEQLHEQIGHAVGHAAPNEIHLLVPSDIRPAVRHLTESRYPTLMVLGNDEVTRDTTIHVAATVDTMAAA